MCGWNGHRLLLVWAFVLVAGIVFLAAGGLVGLGIDTLRRQMRKRPYRLPEGVTIEMVLHESPYNLVRGRATWGNQITWWTGELVEWEDPDGAEAWIIRQYLKQRRDERQNRTSG